MVAQYLIHDDTDQYISFFVHIRYHAKMTCMRSTIHFNIWQEDGMYVAAAVDVPIATEGGTFEELQENIRDVIAVYFEDEDLASLGFKRLPTILTNLQPVNSAAILSA